MVDSKKFYLRCYDYLLLRYYAMVCIHLENEG